MGRLKIKGRLKTVRWPFRLLVVLSVLALLFLLAVGFLYQYRNDAHLARFIMEKANPNLRGRIEFGKVHWDPKALVNLAIDAPVSFIAEHVAFYDPRGTRVIYAPRVTGKMDLKALLYGKGLVFHKVKVKGGEVVVAPMAGSKDGELKIGLFETFGAAEPSSGGGEFKLEFNDFEVEQSRARFKFDSWSLELDQLASNGSVRYPGGPPEEVGLLFKHQTTVAKGVLTIGEAKLPLRDLSASNLGSDTPSTDLNVELSTTASGARIRASGKLVGLYGDSSKIALKVTARKINRLLTHLAGTPVGDGARIIGSLSGSLNEPQIKASVFGVDLGQDPLRITRLQGQLLVDLPRKAITATKISGALMGGRFSGGGAMDLSTEEWNGHFEVDRVDPGHLDPVLAGRLDGSMALKGGLETMKKGLAVLRLKLQRSRRDLLPREVAIGGSVHLGSKIIDLAGVTLQGDGNTLKARGSVNVGTKSMDLYLGLRMPRLGTWLATRGLPRVAEAAHTAGEVHLTGSLPKLRATGKLVAEGIGYGPLRLKQVHSDLEFTGGTLHLRQVRAEGYGGKVDGGARVDLFAGDLTRRHKVPLVQAHFKANGLDLTALGAGPYAIGRLFAEGQISGPLDDLKGSATVRVPRATIQGERYESTLLRVGLLRDRVSVYQGQMIRAGGGRLSMWGDLYFDQRLDLRLKIERFPVVGIPELSGAALGLGGRIDGQVKLTGTLDDLRLGGKVKLADAKVRGVSLGSGELDLTPGQDAVQLKGRFFGKLLTLEGHLLLSPHPRLQLTLNVTRLPLERVFYEVRRIGDVRGLMDGRIRLAFDAKKGLTWADARFPRVRLFLRYRPPGRRKVRVVNLANQQDLLARYDGRQLHVVKTRLLTTVAGHASQRAEFMFGGWLGPGGTDLRVQGKVALAILEFFLAKKVKKLSGDATADIRLSGPLTNPRLTGKCDLHKVRIQMPKFERRIQIPFGRIQLVPGALRVAGLQVLVGRQKMTASGSVRLDRFRPTIADLKLQGDFNFKLLELFLPQQIANASGTAWVTARLTGPIGDPQLSGRLKVRRIEFSPRGWGRTITLLRGDVSFQDWVVRTIKPLEGTYDEGMLRVSGNVRLNEWDFVDVYLKIAGTGIPQRQPNVYSADLNLDLLLRGHSKYLELLGEIELVDVRYVRKFDIIRQAFIKPRVHEEETPFWKGSPTLENLKLKLQVRSTGQMQVKNNYANLSLSGAFGVEGTLALPRLDGQIRVEDGTFRIPFLRGDYSIRRGSIAFNKRKEVDQAELSISGETLFLDPNGVDYQIKLLLEGPLNRIGIKLSSTPSLEQGQIWSLLATGRTTQQLRAQLKGTDSGGGAAGSGGEAAGAADAQVKQLTSEILNNIVVDKLSKVTRLDLLRFEMGTESAQVSAKKKLGRYVSLAGEYELGLLGDTRAEGRLEFKMHDLMMLVGKLERLSTRLETEEQDPSRGRIELKLRLPIR